MSKILVTGANGFLGSSLCGTLQQAGYYVIEAVRRNPKKTQCSIGELSEFTNPISAFEGCDVVVHCAARVHVLHEKSLNSVDAFRVVNVHGTLNLALQAAAAGVRRFVFLSSIGVNGAETFRKPFTAQLEVAPHSPYAVSKYEAELGLHALAVETGMEVVIIRPPLVYGPDAPGNFGSLLRWLERDLPLPLGAIHNQRSFVALDNLIDLIVTCITHPAAANQTFLVSDGEDVSTTELLRSMGKAMGHPARLVPVPVELLKLAATMLGKRSVVQSLCGSLQVDIEKTRRLLHWKPPLSLEQGLKKAAKGYRREAGI